MKNISSIYLIVLLALGINLNTGIAQAQVPFAETFRTGTVANMVFGGNPTASLTAGKTVAYPGGTVADGVNDGFLRLTAANGNERGYAYNANSFPATYGLRLSFEYFSYGGNGADGICFNRFAATTPAFSIGGFGGSLGYAARNGETGLSGAYLGIGLDEYGNFSNYTEGRNTPSTNGALTPNSVTLRGKGDGTSNYWYNNVANGVPNYNYITHVQTTSLSPAFSIGSGNARHTSTTDSGYRKVEIDLIPRTITVGTTTGTAYTINVRIITGSASGPVVHNVITGVTYDQIAPANLKFGYAASTGGSNNYHEIRNIDIRNYDPAPYNPVAANRTQSVCSGNTSHFSLIGAVTPKNLPFGLDSNSLRFINPLNPLDTGTTFSYPNIGTISVDANGRGGVTFVASPNFTSGTASINYVMKDNYSKISNVATLTLDAGTGITGNTISQLAGSSFFAGALPVYGSGYTYLWEVSTTSAISGFYAAPGINNTKDYIMPVKPAAGQYWYRRTVSSGSCTSYSNAMAMTIAYTPLPVTLVSFAAKAQTSNVAVSWATADEQDIQSYKVERSADGRTFKAVSEQAARNKNTQHYNFIDDAPIDGRSYYRLAIQDLHAGTSYSAIVPVSFGEGKATASLMLYPEPANTTLQVATATEGTATVLNAQGTVITRTNMSNGINTMDISALPAGVYYFIFEANAERIVRKFTRL